MRLPLLLAAVVVLAGSFAFADDDSDESKAIEKLQLLGGMVWRDNGYPPDRSVTGVDFHGNNNLNQNGLHLLKSFDRHHQSVIVNYDEQFLGLREQKPE